MHTTEHKRHIHSTLSIKMATEASKTKLKKINNKRKENMHGIANALHNK